MILIGCPILFSLLLLRANSQHLSDVVNSALSYYRSRSALLIFDETRSGILQNAFPLALVQWCPSQRGNPTVKFAINKNVERINYFGHHKLLVLHLWYSYNHITKILDLFTFITAQKRLSSGKNFYLSSITTPSNFQRSVRVAPQSVRETVVGWDPSDNFSLLLEEVSNGAGLKSSPKWFLMTSTLTPKVFDNVTIPINVEFTIAYGSTQSGYSLSEIYDLPPGRKLTNNLGRWSVQLPPSIDIFKRRGDFRGTAIRAMSPKRDNCDGKSFTIVVNSVVWCINQKLWLMIEEMLNATTELQLNPDLNEDSIPHGNADLSLRTANVNGHGLDKTDFIWPTLKAEFYVYTRQLKEEVAWETYILPFTERMWAAILVWLILWDVLLAFVRFVTVNEKKKSFSRCFCELSFTTTSVFSSQGVPCLSKQSSIRIMFLMAFIVPAVLFPGYSAVLTSFLTIQRYTKPVHDLVDMSRNSEHKLAWHRTLSREIVFNMKNPLDADLVQNNALPYDKMPASDEEGIKRMCSEKLSYLTIWQTLVALKPRCRYYKINFKLFFASIELKKNSPYKYFMDRCARTLEFTGINRRMEEQVVMDEIDWTARMINIDEEPQPIKLNNIVLPFAVLLFGVLISALLLLLEVISFQLDSTRSSVSWSPDLKHHLYDFVL